MVFLRQTSKTVLHNCYLSLHGLVCNELKHAQLYAFLHWFSRDNGQRTNKNAHCRVSKILEHTIVHLNTACHILQTELYYCKLFFHTNPENKLKLTYAETKVERFFFIYYWGRGMHFNIGEFVWIWERNMTITVKTIKELKWLT